MASRAMIELAEAVPCMLCGYQGPGFFQEGTHDENCPWYKVGGAGPRAEMLPSLLKEWYALSLVVARGLRPDIRDVPIPDDTRESIDAYVKRHEHPGNFLVWVLSNNLKESLGQADDRNLQAIFSIVKYCYWEIPSVCWGSPEVVKAWIAEGGERGGRSGG